MNGKLTPHQRLRRARALLRLLREPLMNGPIEEWNGLPLRLREYKSRQTYKTLRATYHGTIYWVPETLYITQRNMTGTPNHNAPVFA